MIIWNVKLILNNSTVLLLATNQKRNDPEESGIYLIVMIQFAYKVSLYSFYQPNTLFLWKHYILEFQMKIL